MIELSPVDLEGYLGRVGVARPPAPTPDGLELLHRAHLARIPFENLDVRLGRPIRLDLESLAAKMVTGRRGGYCFEQNTLFAAALRSLGFEVAKLEARVRPPGATGTLPRTHMLLKVEVGGQSWLADVGFGGDGPLAPVAMNGDVAEQSDGAYRVKRESGGISVLRRRWRGEWRDLYAFRSTPAQAVDFEVANHYTSTYPSSIFLRTLTVQRSETTVRHILRGRVYTVRHGREETSREIEAEELPTLLNDAFGLDVPAEEATRALG